MWGRATLAMEVSRTSMNAARATVMAINQGLTRGFHPTCETGSGLRISFVDSWACGKAGSAAAFADYVHSPWWRDYESVCNGREMRRWRWRERTTCGQRTFKSFVPLDRFAWTASRFTEWVQGLKSSERHQIKARYRACGNLRLTLLRQGPT